MTNAPARAESVSQPLIVRSRVTSARVARRRCGPEVIPVGREQPGLRLLGGQPGTETGSRSALVRRNV